MVCEPCLNLKWACGPVGLLAMPPNPISAAGAIRSQPCLIADIINMLRKYITGLEGNDEVPDA